MARQPTAINATSGADNHRRHCLIRDSGGWVHFSDFNRIPDRSVHTAARLVGGGAAVYVAARRLFKHARIERRWEIVDRALGNIVRASVFGGVSQWQCQPSGAATVPTPLTLTDPLISCMRMCACVCSQINRPINNQWTAASWQHHSAVDRTCHVQRLGSSFSAAVSACTALHSGCFLCVAFIAKHDHNQLAIYTYTYPYISSI